MADQRAGHAVVPFRLVVGRIACSWSSSSAASRIAAASRRAPAASNSWSVCTRMCRVVTLPSADWVPKMPTERRRSSTPRWLPWNPQSPVVVPVAPPAGSGVPREPVDARGQLVEWRCLGGNLTECLQLRHGPSPSRVRGLSLTVSQHGGVVHVSARVLLRDLTGLDAAQVRCVVRAISLL